MPAAKQPIIRDSNYKEEYCEKIIEWFKQGQTIVEVSQNMGVTRQTYYDWKKKYPEFKQAADFGEEAAEAFYAKIGRFAMLGFPDKEMKKQYKDFNTAIYCFKMKTRFKWRENENVEADPNEISNAQPLQITFSVAAPVKEIEVTNSIAQQLEKQEEEDTDDEEE